MPGSRLVCALTSLIQRSARRSWSPTPIQTSRSAGSRIGSADHVHPVVLEVMAELGIDLSDRKPQLLTRELAQWADVVVTMGCGDQCPVIPGKRYIDWELADPAGRPIVEVRATRDDINHRVHDLLAQFQSSTTIKETA